MNDQKYLLKISSFVLLLLLLNNHINAQQGISYSASYDFFPYSNLADPNKDTFLENLKIRVATLKLKVSYPISLSKNTILINELLYDRFDMDYKNWNELQGGENISHGHAIKYNLVIMSSFYRNWSFVGVITPGLASDFRSKLSKDDVTFEAALIFIHQFSKKFSLGGGLAYSRQFGEPLPLPVMTLDWNNGSNLFAKAILPANFEFWYLMSPILELGLVLSGDGNEYHGDPDRYGGTNPKMKYSVITLGPSLKYRLSRTFSLNIDSGYTFLRKFEFSNEISGDDYKEILDLKNAGYIRVGFNLGG
jgi:Domain of unknown function (DUF6268)